LARKILLVLQYFKRVLHPVSIHIQTVERRVGELFKTEALQSLLFDVKVSYDGKFDQGENVK